MRKSAFNLYDLLENLLEWSVLQRGLTTFEPVTFVLKPIISEGLPLALETAQQKEITIKYEVNDDIEVFADQKMFETIMRNLVSNAVKYTRKGGEIAITAKKSTDELVDDQGAAGSSMQTLVPSFSLLSTVIFPFISSTNSLHSINPSPVPGS